MATSGSISGNAKNNGSITTKYEFWAEWKRNGSYDIEKNTSNITVSLKIKCTAFSDGAYNLEKKPSVSLSVNGAAKTPTISHIDTRNYATCTFATWTGDVAHKNDGSLSCPISASFEHYGSSSLDAGSVSGKANLDTIPRATTLDSLSCATNYFTGKLTYKYTPKSNAVYNRCNISLNLDGDYIAVKSVNLGKKSAAQQTATVTLASDELETIYENLPSTTKGVLRFTFRTYSDSGYSNQIGDAVHKEVTLNIPDDETTKASVSMTLSLVGSLPEAFEGLYVQGKTKVKATLSAEGQYGADIKSYSMKVDGTTYDSDDDYTSDYLAKSGSLTVYGYAKDSRGYTGSTSESITVIGYANPKILNVEAYRCDEEGNPADNGTYLKIKAQRSYSPINSDGEQKNFCRIRYRYKLSSDASYSSWTTILAKDELTSDQVETDALLSGNLSAASTYMVQVQAIDDIGGYASTTIAIPTEKVYCHRNGEKNSFTFGGYVEEENTFAIAAGINFKVKSVSGETVVVSDTGWIDLGLSSSVSEPGSDYEFGRKGPGCFYRVINGNHVYVAFNCACEYAGENVQVNATLIPSKYRPERYCYDMLPTGGRAVVRAFVSPAGVIKIGWMQELSANANTTAGSITWVDGYIDYWV